MLLVYGALCGVHTWRAALAPPVVVTDRGRSVLHLSSRGVCVRAEQYRLRSNRSWRGRFRK